MCKEHTHSLDSNEERFNRCNPIFEQTRRGDKGITKNKNKKLYHENSDSDEMRRYEMKYEFMRDAQTKHKTKLYAKNGK